MKRIVVTNSALAYPPVPPDVLRPDDLVLPLVERFEEALFMAGPGYDELRELFPDFNLQVRALSLEIASLLPDWLGEPVEEWGHSAWDALADHFVKFSLGPLIVNSLLAEHAAALEPQEVLAWELASTDGWWSGRQMVGEVAEAIATQSGARLTRRSSALRRLFRQPLMRFAAPRQAEGFFTGLRCAHYELPEAECDVVFVLAGPTLVPIFDRLGSHLRERHGLKVLGIETPQGGPDETIAPGTLERASLYAFSEPAIPDAGRLDARRASRDTSRVAARLTELPTLADLPPPLLQVLARRLRTTLIRDVTESVCHARLWQRALHHLRPRVLVAFNAYNDKLAPAVLQARHRGIPAMTLQHGIWGPLFKAAALLPFDEVLIFGDYAREMLRPIAADHTRFIRTGHSLYDEVFEPVDGSQLRAELLGEREHLVTVTTQPVELRLSTNESRWWLRGLADACEQLNALMVIKPHPHEEAALSRYRALSEQMTSVRLIPHGEVSLEQLIAASDLLVTRFSTTAFEAALLGVPVMTVNLSGGPDQYPFAEEGAALGVAEYDQLLPALRSLLIDPQTRAKVLEGQQPFLDRHLGSRDGQATERIAERIVEQAHRNG